MTVTELFLRNQDEKSDIYAHLPFLRACAERYDVPRIIELGVRTGRSTSAFLSGIGAGHLWSVDMDQPQVPAAWRGLDCWSFLQADDLSEAARTWLPDRCDILFIDTSHVYEYTVAELLVYAPRVVDGGLILMHDTEYPEINCIPTPPHESDVGRALDWWCPLYGQVWENRSGCFGLGVVRVM